MPNSHPLDRVAASVCHFKCFGDEPAGFEEFKPINVVIGRNNSGKSALLDLIELCISRGQFFDQSLHGRRDAKASICIGQIIPESILRQVFREDRSGGLVNGINWEYGKRFINSFFYTSIRSGELLQPMVGQFPEVNGHYRDRVIAHIQGALTYPFENLNLQRVAAERRVLPEPADNSYFTLKPNGEGVTNVIRAFITQDPKPRKIVERDLLNDLNTVYRGDSRFERILCRERANAGGWELFLAEKDKGDIRLSESGSSLQSVFIILARLQLYSLIGGVDWSQVVFAVEEPENNLHPSLLRRLLDFLANQRDEKGFTLIITTHSPICIDWSTRREDSQVIHVRHHGKYATTRTAVEYQHNKEIIEDLDLRASDLLQANGVIWVEGPTERIYLNAWIKIASDGELKEGIHYTIMFYGGRLLSHLDVLPPDEGRQLISLLSINRNCALLMDSDRHFGSKQSKGKPRLKLNATKKRIIEEIKRTEGFVWVTEDREIENYTPIKLFARVAGKSPPTREFPYDKISDLPLLNDFKGKKTDLAHRVAEIITKADIEDFMDLWPQLESLCKHIRRWNSI